MKNARLHRLLARLLIVALCVSQTAQVAALTLANSPLAATTTSTVRPNLMYVLDDSGSMAWDFTPDYINDNTVKADPGSMGGSAGDGVTATISGGKVTALAPSNGTWDATYSLGTPTVYIIGGGGTGASAHVTLNASTKKVSSIVIDSQGSGYTSAPHVVLVGGLPNATWGMCWGTSASNAGGVPLDTTASPICSSRMIPYSTAAINYQAYDPAVRYEAPIKADGSRYPDATPTAAKDDGYTASSTTNLASYYSGEVWCNSATAVPTSADPTAGGKCKLNVDTSGNTLYPNAVYTYRKIYYGKAFYYVMDPVEYCTDGTYTNCVRATTSQVLSGVTYNVPSTYRWCSYYDPASHSFGNCQGHRDWTHYIPNYLGGWVSTGSAGLPATAALTVNSVANGQSITDILIDGTSIVGGAPIVATGASTTTSVASAICSAVQANAASTGYNCAASGNVATLQSMVYGDTQPPPAVTVSVPTDVAAVNATGKITVSSPTTAGYQISSIKLHGNELIGSTITSDGNAGNTARNICLAIIAGPNLSSYTARSGDLSSPTLAFGTCNADVTAVVEVKRIPTDTVDNGFDFVVTGPTGSSGSITINTTGGATRINDITLAGTSILGAAVKPLTYADGSLTTVIAADVASKLNSSALMTGCTAAASGSAVNITGSCTGALAVSSTAAAATGTFRVASTGSTHAGDLGGIQISTTDLVGHVTSSQLTNGTSVSTNATTLRTLLNNATSATSGGVGPHGFTAAAPVAASGGAYDVTVTAPLGSSYNNLSFNFLPGTSASGSTGSAPGWTFQISDATADNAKITAITCGGTNVVTQNTASTGAGSSYDYIYNLAINGSTNGLNGRSYNGYSYSCTTPTPASPSSHCTITKAGSPACNGFDTPNVDAGITLTTPARTQSGGTGSSPTWKFDITGASADNATVSSIQCGGTELLSGNASTGAASTYASVLAAAIASQAANGAGNWSGSAASHDCHATSATALTCQLCRKSESNSTATANRCSPTANITVSTDAGLTASTPSESHAVVNGGWRWCYNFDVTGADAANERVTHVSCTGSSTDAVLNASTGSAIASADLTRINTLAFNNGSNDLESRTGNGYSMSCNTATAGTPKSTCTVTGPVGVAACSSLTFTKDASITIANQSQPSAGSASQPSIWEFDITAATAANAEINRLRCNNTSTFDENADPSAGTSSIAAWQRINNLTQGGTGLNGLAINGYAVSCSAATSTSAFSNCTVTGPVGTSACGTAPYLSISKAASITTGTISQTSAGGAAGAAVDDFAPALTTVSAFSGGYAAQGVSVSGLNGSGTIATTTVAMANGTPPSLNAIQITPLATNLSGGQNPDTSANHWTDLGRFRRIDIDSAVNSYARASGRTDCLGSTCTYAEELQNFANWHSYYRTRMNLMKSASTLAFSQLDGKYRIGFDNICDSTTTTVKRTVAQFQDSGGEVANQRTNWWNSLTAATPSCATPLRSETAKIGRYFAGKLGSSDPIQYSCQQNFMFLVTDGYWNEYDTASISGVLSADIGNTDNNLATAARPYYDGQVASTTCPAVGSARGSTASSCRTLADVTWYYYSTDLRSSPNEVVMTTSGPHGLNSGQTYTITGASPASFNGTYVVFVNNSTQFGYTASASPGTYLTGGMINGVAITTASYGSGRFGNALNAAGVDVSTNNVLPSADDKNQAQHMNFYAMGLGIDGTLAYRSDYVTAGVGDYAAIAAGTKNWPAVANLDPTGVDDLWHATVNGHGKYFSARNLPNVVAGLREALNKIGSRVGSAAAAATSNLEPVAGDNFAYVASYATVDWVGDLQSRSINLTTGEVSPDTNCTTAGSGCQWSAQGKLDAMAWAARRIYAKPTSGMTGDPLRPFTYANLTVGEQAYFNPNTLSQYAALSLSNSGDITASNLVNFLRGDRSLEQDGDIAHAQIWRHRAHVLGDIVDTQPVFMKAPAGYYNDTGYSTFRDSSAAHSRTPVVFVSAQDGMLHAFNAHTAAVTVNGTSVAPGEEMWAYIPQQSMAAMKKLADVNYAHQYFIDGVIMTADVDFGGGDWHTILVAGQGAGGTSYFALDVTDPLVPKFLWEFTDSRLGYSFANPIASKLPGAAGWAVFFTSGYNNGDGVGYLFAVDPKTGAIKSGYPLSNASGTGAAPSNLGKLALWATDPVTDNTAEYAYAGDLNGDLWRFTISDKSVFKLAQLTNSAGVAQPITTKPVATNTTDGTHIVLIGTGKYLEMTDLTSTDQQSVYAIRDSLASGQATANPRTDTYLDAGSPVPSFLQRRLLATRDDGSVITTTDGSGATRAVRMLCSGPASYVSALTNACAGETGSSINWGTNGGWFIDLEDAGERVNVDLKLVQGTVVFASNIPASTSCTVGGSAWFTTVGFSTGLEVISGDKLVSTKIPSSLVVGLAVIKLASGEYKAIVTKSDYSQETFKVPVGSSATSNPRLTPNGAFMNTRSLWREFEAQY